MTFSSLTFLFVFLPVCLGLYCALNHFFPHSWRTKSVLLILASLLFYAWNDSGSLLILVCLSVINLGFGYEIEACQQGGRMARIWCGSACLLNVAVLCLYKYSALAMPLGISFYTFSAISYVVDVYRNKIQRLGVLDSLLYLLFFPKLLMGPIAQFADFSGQVRRARPHLSTMLSGFYLFMIGLFCKLLLADQLGSTFSVTQSLPSPSVLTAWIGTIAYGLQLYFDFSGYSLMAMGIAALFGFRLPLNFNYPYRSCSITDFWRRWHITLGAWFRDYVYIPLGGNRVTPSRHLANLTVVWLLTGIWHGSTWNFVIWGIYHAAFIVGEKFLLKGKNPLPKGAQIVICNAIVFIGWVFFFTPTLASAFGWLKTMCGIGAASVIDAQGLYLLESNVTLIISGILASGPLLDRLTKKALSSTRPLVRFTMSALIVGAFILCICSMIGATYSTFMYAKF